jgi:hypothetical protein
MRHSGDSHLPTSLTFLRDTRKYARRLSSLVWATDLLGCTMYILSGVSLQRFTRSPTVLSNRPILAVKCNYVYILVPIQQPAVDFLWGSPSVVFLFLFDMFPFHRCVTKYVFVAYILNTMSVTSGVNKPTRGRQPEGKKGEETENNNARTQQA